jgi:hypothetical protein
VILPEDVSREREETAAAASCELRLLLGNTEPVEIEVPCAECDGEGKINGGIECVTCEGGRYAFYREARLHPADALRLGLDPNAEPRIREEYVGTKEDGDS